ncbi:MAG: hypothetical protein COU32_03355 [Candidatus Magasanikbacteria bacterium CG10_big_fil_rev_8_21_14_0_10_42_10]|uniref:Uncharacterized protein n=1 Tax=Candidatus Magasanikbacteria bacterium CG10_big_fil_rev_8_21_14_0_10_42_10 TaxID=1974649 RepID=A0A2H0TVP0_9BACT|nr:MAG: hypothetical protein COU32_03355 [Candidatus Magasanikbacteria bacterium CG10_big_fil_rev_8_21_14_0_10_42_10]
MRVTIIVMSLVLIAIWISGCYTDITGVHHGTSDVIQPSGNNLPTVITHDVGERMFGKVVCSGTCNITIIRPDGTAVPLWYKWGDVFLLDETTTLDHYVASEEDTYFELVEDEWIVLVLEDAPPENGGPPMVLISHQQAFQFTNNFGEPTCFLDIWDMDVGARHEYFVLFVPGGTCF